MASRGEETSRPALATAVAILASVFCCREPTSADTFDEPGLIVFYGDTTRIVAPDTALRGVPFEVSFVTFAGGCTREVARTEVQIATSVLEVRPYNRRRRAPACTDDLLFLEHRAEVQFDEAGLVTIRVVGEQRGTSTGSGTAPARIEQSIVVR